MLIEYFDAAEIWY